MIATMAWKEYREQRTVCFFIALMAVVLILLVTQVYPALNNGTQSSDTSLHLMIASAGCVLTYGIVCGSMLLAGEREASTLGFLDALTGRRLPVWCAKLIPAVVLCIVQGLFVGSLAAFLYPGGVSDPAIVGRGGREPDGWIFVFALPVLALDALVWGLLGSALFQSVLSAAAAAAMSWLLGWLLLFPCWAANTMLPALGGRILLDLAVLGLSAAVFCQSQTLEQSESAVVAPRRMRVPRTPSSWGVLIWLPLRQGWVMLLILFPVSLFLGLLLPPSGPLFWFGFTTIVAVLCGVSTFGPEQSDGACRFLGNQRFPLSQVWGVKIGFWFLALLIIAGAFLASGIFCLLVVRPAEVPPLHELTTSSPILNEGKALIFVPLGIVYGFCVGQFYSLIWRKSVVAVVMALLVSPCFALLWLPSLTFGGLKAWLVFTPPVVLLAATWLVMWSWGSTGLALRKPVMTLAGCGAFCLLWFAGGLFYRALEVPGFDLPYDTAVFKNNKPTVKGEGATAAPRMNGAAVEFGDRLSQLADPKLPLQLRSNGQADSDRTRTISGRAAELLNSGWPQQDKALDVWLDQLFKPSGKRGLESWDQVYLQVGAMELGCIEDMEDGTLNRDLTTARRATEAGTFLAARALQFQRAGKAKEALDLIDLMLALSRQLRNYALTVSYGYGRQLEQKALGALDRWLTTRRSSDLLRRAVTMLKQHEQQIPPVSLSVCAEDTRMRQALESGTVLKADKLTAAGTSQELELVSSLWLAPWERSRYTRVLNALTTAGLRVAELEPAEAARLLESVNGAQGDRILGRMVNRGLSLLYSNQSRSELESWQQLLADNVIDKVYRVESLEDRVQDGFNTAALRAARLKAAILLFQETQGKGMPENLDDLVQSGCIDAVPPDPFDGDPFRYRRTNGKDVVWNKGSEGEEVPRVPDAVTAILWSVGPDGIDHGGRIGGSWIKVHSAGDWAAQNLDVLFAVPEWRKKQ
jgi:hypothetical protein